MPITGYSNTISVTTLAPSLLLDLYPSAAAAYSVRKLRTAYTGSAIRVRRSSDNAEQDIGFSGGNLDTSALTSFCGAGNGFVTTWYDQSGNAQDVTNSSATLQPQIVSSGTIILANTKPAIYFDTNDDYLIRNAPNGGVLAMNTHSSVFVHKVGATWDNYYDVYERRVLSYAEGSGTNYAPFGDITTKIASYWNGSGVTPSTTAFAVNTQYINNLIGNTTNLGKLYLNNSLILTDANKIGDSNITPSPYLFIGNYTSEYTEKYVQEVVLWASDQTSSISSINTNVNAYYNVY